MTDRVHSLTVVLERDVRVDDVEVLANAVKQLRGVSAVGVNVADVTTYMAEERARTEMQAKILKALRETS